MKSLCDVSCTEPKKEVEQSTQGTIEMGKEASCHYWIPWDALLEIEKKLQSTCEIWSWELLGVKGPCKLAFRL